jgi:transposase
VFRIDEALKVYLHREPIDFRLNINGLALMVEQALGLDPFAACVYVFSNRRRNRVKILGWERNGFWLLLRRLEKVWRDDLDETRATNKMRVAAGRMMPTLIDAGKDYGEGWLSRGDGTPTFLGVA